MTHPIDRSRLQQFGSLEFHAKQVVEGFITGLHKSPFHGFSVEFAEHRLYNQGESTRHIDWKLYGRTDRLYVKRYEEETNLRCHIVLDTSSSMYFPLQKEVSIDHPNKLTFSVYAAASLITLFKRQRDAFGLTTFSDAITLHTRARSSTVHQQFLFAEMEKLLISGQPEQKKGTHAAEALHHIAENIHKRSLVILFSDMFDNGTDAQALFDALQHLRHNKHEVILFHVTDKQHELDFDYPSRPHRFIDLESGQEIKINPGQVRDHYHEQLKKYYHELALRCRQYRIDFVEADLTLGYQQILLPYLLKRKKMF